MELKGNPIKRAVLIAFALLITSPAVTAQERNSEISVEGSGLFTKSTDDNLFHNNATNSGGFLVGYRYNFNSWLSAEADYGWSRNTQIYSGSVPARIQSGVQEATAAAVVSFPIFGRLTPFVLAGGGALVFDPTNNSGGTFAGASTQAKGAFLYGAGADFTLTHHWALRGEYRGLIYKVPDFNVAGLHSDNWTHAAQPSAGIVFRF